MGCEEILYLMDLSCVYLFGFVCCWFRCFEKQEVKNKFGRVDMENEIGS